jgi:hypothetical protein
VLAIALFLIRLRLGDFIMANACAFSFAQLKFSGAPVEQAKCLLRRVRIGGNIDNQPAELPAFLETNVGNNVGFTAQQLSAYLDFKGISAADIGGPLSGAVSKTSNGTLARYFVIHDTSDELPGDAFPADMDKITWRPNRLDVRNITSAHIFINRLGQSATGHNYSVAWRATKREADVRLKGLFLHHELVQPRIKGGHSYHAVAPQPGFTAAMLERLALCYAAASRRKGTWLIPAFHCVLDTGISDGHDDPQNFDLFQWASAVEKLAADIQKPSGIALGLETRGARALRTVRDAVAKPEVETVRSDLSDGFRKVTVQRIKGTTPLFFKAKMSIDADGAARAYHPKNDPEALDVLKHSTGHSTKYIQGKNGKGPRPGFYVSMTALSRGPENDAGSFPDAEFVPYIVLPAKFAKSVERACLCTVVNLRNWRSTSAIFADTNPEVGEASVRAAIDLHVQDPSFPITRLARFGGDEKANYVYIVYPGSKIAARSAPPRWPVDAIKAEAEPLFAAWGGIEMVKRLFG